MRSRESPRRTDWLREFHGLLLAGVVVSIVVGVVGVVTMLTGQPLDVAVSSEAVLRPDALVDVRPGASIDPDTSVHVRVADPTGTQLGWATVALVPSYALTTTMLILLWRLVRRARRADPFTDSTVNRLRTLGGLLVVGGPVTSAVESVARFALSGTVTTGGSHATLDLAVPAVWVLAGVGMFAVGEVVRRGRALRAELDGVV